MLCNKHSTFHNIIYPIFDASETAIEYVESKKNQTVVLTKVIKEQQCKNQVSSIHVCLNKQTINSEYLMWKKKCF